jgi:NTE family protein
MQNCLSKGIVLDSYLKKKTYSRFKKEAVAICQGGGAKGAWQAGVLYELHQKKINFVTFFGTSVGALNASLCFTGQWDFLRMLWQERTPVNVFKKKCKCWPFRLNKKALYTLIDSHIDEDRVAEAIISGKRLYLRVSNLSTGLSELKLFDSNNRDGDLANSLKASCALYPYFPTVQIDSQHYADGGLAANCPSDFADKLGIIESIIISPTRWPMTQQELNCKSKINRMIDMLLYSQLIADLNLLKLRLRCYNIDLPSSPNFQKTVYIICPSKDLNNETTKITVKGSKQDYDLGVSDANLFLKSPGDYDLEKQVLIG